MELRNLHRHVLLLSCDIFSLLSHRVVDRGDLFSDHWVWATHYCLLLSITGRLWLLNPGLTLGYGWWSVSVWVSAGARVYRWDLVLIAHLLSVRVWWVRHHLGDRNWQVHRDGPLSYRCILALSEVAEDTDLLSAGNWILTPNNIFHKRNCRAHITENLHLLVHRLLPRIKCRQKRAPSDWVSNVLYSILAWHLGNILNSEAQCNQIVRNELAELHWASTGADELTIWSFKHNRIFSVIEVFPTVVNVEHDVSAVDLHSIFSIFSLVTVWVQVVLLDVAADEELLKLPFKQFWGLQAQIVNVHRLFGLNFYIRRLECLIGALARLREPVTN